MSDSEIIKGIEDVIRLAIDMGQPVFVGSEAFDCCAVGFQTFVHQGEFYQYLELCGIEIILCEHLQSKNFFTCPMMDFPLSRTELLH